MMFKAKALSVLILSTIMSLQTPVLADTLQENYSALRELEQSFKDKQIEINTIQQELSNKSNSLIGSDQQLAQLTNEKNSTEERLARLQKIDRENPDFGLSGKVSAAQSEYATAHQKVKNEENRNIQLRREIDKISLTLSAKKAGLEKLKSDLNGIRNIIVDKLLEQNIQQLQTPKQYVGTAEVTCQDTETVRSCLQRSKEEAERNASEKGSIVVIDSVSEIKNFKIKKDEVRSEVRAQLSNIRVLAKDWTGDYTYRYQVQAMVSPVISPTLRAQMRQSIIVDLDSRLVNESRVINIVPPAASEKQNQAEPATQVTQEHSDTDKIIELMGVAKNRIAAKQFFLPSGASAYSAYKEVLNIDPGYNSAQTGIDKLEAAMISVAQKASEGGKKDLAIKLLSATLKEMPESSKMEALLGELSASN